MVLVTSALQHQGSFCFPMSVIAYCTTTLCPKRNNYSKLHCIYSYCTMWPSMSFTPEVDVTGAEEIIWARRYLWFAFFSAEMKDGDKAERSSLVSRFRSPSRNAITMGQDRLASKCPANFVLNTERLSFSMACMWNFVSRIVSHCLQTPLIILCRCELFWHPTAFVCGT